MVTGMFIRHKKKSVHCWRWLSHTAPSPGAPVMTLHDFLSNTHYYLFSIKQGIINSNEKISLSLCPLSLFFSLSFLLSPSPSRASSLHLSPSPSLHLSLS